MTRRTLFIIISIAVLIIIARIALTDKPVSIEGADLASLCKNGDLLFVSGDSIANQVVRILDIGETDYSHLGIIIMQEGNPYLLHADPHAKGVDFVKLESYLAERIVLSAALYRLRGQSSAAYSASRAAYAYYQSGVQFDLDFDLKSDDQMYCTEIIWKAYRKAGIDLAGGTASDEPLHGQNNLILWPSNVLADDRLSKIAVLK